MEKKIEIPTNVREILTNSATEVGKQAEALFDMDVWIRIQEKEIGSPIEQTLFIGLMTVQKLNSIDDMQPVTISNAPNLAGFQITPQYSIGKFRVDFAVTYRHFTKHDKDSLKEITVLVECDSQQFHERSENERRYEKQRDRFIQKEGYKVFRYTGSEILKDPFSIAAEIVSFVTSQPIEDIQTKSF